MLQYFFVPELLPQDEVEISFIHKLLSHILSLKVGLQITVLSIGWWLNHHLLFMF